jgi:hypothetical protein
VIEKAGRRFFVVPPAAFQAHEVIAFGHNFGELLALRAMEREQDFVVHQPVSPRNDEQSLIET